jgi:hypothetical protein
VAPTEVEFIVHRAAAPDPPVQLCADCGQVIQDNTAWYEGRVAVPDDTPAPLQGPSWWPARDLVAASTGLGPRMRYAVAAGRALDSDERYCWDLDGGATVGVVVTGSMITDADLAHAVNRATQARRTPPKEN